jgi:hypothetical protein
MKSIKISVNAIRDGEVASGAIMKQRKRGETWVNEETISIVSGEPGSERTFILDNDQRLIIEAVSNVKVVYDREQSVATPQISPLVRQVASPVDTDGDESPQKPALDRALEPRQLEIAAAEERRLAAIAAARQKLRNQS